ncbi:nickel/cobalt efflux transporter [Rhizobium ruizarguesonis]|uniref:nickel/cobalt efflux transporter n=1 Tax=Rhizobium ruizarguesonis TaxID=2081791 RepID=UPI0014478C56|nr:nickel/cobalt efflux transporter [Rhizobium ruizarguesonis]NKQ87489.1 nickel/cobalt efflux protein RcnA [Rhizobium ruizarguesonis]
MESFSSLIAQGGGAAWLFIPSAILLGALHGLEPGHSKTMMAAFIVAVRGTVAQSVMLGLAATFSHTMVVWAIALGGMYLFSGLDAETAEPYFQLVSAVIIIGVAAWMFRQTLREQRSAKQYERDVAEWEKTRDKAIPAQRVDTGHGFMSMEITPDKPAFWRLKVVSGDNWTAEYVTLSTERPDGTKQKFTFVDRDGYIESVETIAEPYDFMARLSLDHGDHEHDYDVSFLQGAEADKKQGGGVNLATEGYQDAHALSHANDIRKRFANRQVTTGQIILFGLTGGLIPCPAAITVLLLCLQLKKIPLGAVLVLCFSIGLAITLVVVGAAAAIGVRKATQKFSWLSTVAARAPYFSSAVIIIVGLYMGYHGVNGIMNPHHEPAEKAAGLVDIEGKVVAAVR